MKANKGLNTRIILVFAAVILASVVFTTYSFLQIDSIVHGTLYNYGLQFSAEWANPYWTNLQTIQIALGVISTFVMINTIYVFKKFGYRAQRFDTVSDKTMAKQTKETSTISHTSTSSGSSELSNRCTHCGKTCTQPLRMLDFQRGRPAIISLCPFCNEVMHAHLYH